MNANELAEELDYCYGKEYPCPVSKEAATMLRQQQAEIETLKAGKIRAYDNGVEDGKKSNTNPAKTLTDEEIEDFEWAIKNVLNFSQSEKVVGLDNVIRAILKKASEK